MDWYFFNFVFVLFVLIHDNGSCTSSGSWKVLFIFHTPLLHSVTRRCWMMMMIRLSSRMHHLRMDGCDGDQREFNLRHCSDWSRRFRLAGGLGLWRYNESDCSRAGCNKLVKQSLVELGRERTWILIKRRLSLNEKGIEIPVSLI